MKQGFPYSVLALAALAGACQQQDAKAEGSTIRATARQSAAATPNRAADEAAIRAFLTRTYRRYTAGDDRGDVVEMGLMTPDFVRAYRNCLAVEGRWNRLNPGDRIPEHECMSGDTLVPGNGDLAASVVMRTLRSTIAWQGPNKAQVRVSMKALEYTGETEYVDLTLVRSANGWLIDDMGVVDRDMKSWSYRAGFVSEMAAMRKEMGQR